MLLPVSVEPNEGRGQQAQTRRPTQPGVWSGSPSLTSYLFIHKHLPRPALCQGPRVTSGAVNLLGQGGWPHLTCEKTSDLKWRPHESESVWLPGLWSSRRARSSLQRRSQVNRRDSCSAELVGRSATSVNHYRCRRACEWHSEGRTEVAGEEFGRGNALCA